MKKTVVLLLLISLISLTLTVNGAKRDKNKKERVKKTKKTDKKKSKPPVNVNLKEHEKLLLHLNLVNIPAIKLAMADLHKTHPERYKDKSHIKKLDGYNRIIEKLKNEIKPGEPEAIKKTEELLSYTRKLMLSNPLLDFDKIISLKRDFGKKARIVIGKTAGHMPNNADTLSAVKLSPWENQIIILSGLRNNTKIKTFYKPKEPVIVCDIDLHFDADKLMFSSAGKNKRWHVFEIDINKKTLRQITPKNTPEVNYYDSCYLPDGKILFTSTASMQGEPCRYGGVEMAQLYRATVKGKEIEQLCFEQDSNWTPSMLPDGRVCYLRWEYTDTPHYFTRVLMTMNPDGTEQKAIYGSGSYFPNGIYYAKPLPGTKKIIGIATGHHGIARSGRLIIIDPGISSFEADGIVHEIPFKDRKVEPIILDRLIDGVWPQFIHPYPLNEKYFLVASKPTEQSLWGIYLVDVFDNMTLIREIEDSILLEPIPYRKEKRPPIIPDKTRPGMKEANVYIQDIYFGPGLKGIPRTVKSEVFEVTQLTGSGKKITRELDIYRQTEEKIYYKVFKNGKINKYVLPREKIIKIEKKYKEEPSIKALRLFTYHFNYNKVGGHNTTGIESSWDVKRILGTVPVEEDGSALFTIPANTPISIQPLDKEGSSMQLFRSWFIGRPGEFVSCIGCHETPQDIPPVQKTVALSKVPAGIKKWHGDFRPFSYKFEVQPVLDKYCAACHAGTKGKPDFSDAAEKTLYLKGSREFDNDGATKVYSESYNNLQPYVRRPGPENDYHILYPMEYHSSTSELVQMLKKGHYGVELDKIAWDRLYTWIDFNAPYRGKWSPPEYLGEDQVKVRLKYAKIYANRDDDPESEYDKLEKIYKSKKKIVPIKPKMKSKKSPKVKISNWPLSALKAERMQVKAAQNGKTFLSEKLENEIKMDFTLIPGGKFVMGSTGGEQDEGPLSITTIDKPFWMGIYEVRNIEYHLFDPDHESKFIDLPGKDQKARGIPANEPDQPVIRISWQEAMRFCEWLSKKLNKKVTLPTEAQWEWACRAGTETPFFFGEIDNDFTYFANLADVMIKKFDRNINKGKKGEKETIFCEAYIPRIENMNDYQPSVAVVGSERFKPNNWGLYDIHGNVSEWTRSSYLAYPYREDDGRNDLSVYEEKTVRGGSWRDRPKRATASFRLPYKSYQKVFNVGFRVIIEI